MIDDLKLEIVNLKMDLYFYLRYYFNSKLLCFVFKIIQKFEIIISFNNFKIFIKQFEFSKKKILINFCVVMYGGMLVKIFVIY